MGFLRYWTFSNLPLFLLASPMLGILMSSAIWTWIQSTKVSQTRTDGTDTSRGTHSRESGLFVSAFLPKTIYQGAVRRLLVPQLVLAILALTTYHVQIITRLSSGYPIWYWWLASLTLEDRKVQVLGKYWSPPKIIVQWMICYALIQGGLFASFLPPA